MDKKERKTRPKAKYGDDKGQNFRFERRPRQAPGLCGPAMTFNAQIEAVFFFSRQ
jgi:hypothetical protein